MGQKILSSEIIPLDFVPSGALAPDRQFTEFAEYRDYMAAFCAARSWWLSDALAITADPATKFWFSHRDRALICYQLMGQWYRGYWPTRAELVDLAPNVSQGSFYRILKDAEDAGLIDIVPDSADRRGYLIRPTTATILALGKGTVAYFQRMVTSAPQASIFTHDLKRRLNLILSTEDVRAPMGLSLHREGGGNN